MMETAKTAVSRRQIVSREILYVALSRPLWESGVPLPSGVLMFFAVHDEVPSLVRIAMAMKPPVKARSRTIDISTKCHRPDT
jgi:hypothetical protein